MSFFRSTHAPKIDPSRTIEMQAATIEMLTRAIERAERIVEELTPPACLAHRPDEDVLRWFRKTFPATPPGTGAP